MADSPLKRLGERARELGSRAVGELLKDEQRAEVVGAAVRTLQAARSQLDAQQGRVLAAMGLATQADLERVSRRIGRLRKRLLALRDRLGERT